MSTLIRYSEAFKRQVVEEIERVHKKGRPLLIGTRSVEASETLSSLLNAKALQHVVLNAGKVVLMADDPALRAIVRDCALVNADGISVVWAASSV